MILGELTIRLCFNLVDLLIGTIDSKWVHLQIQIHICTLDKITSKFV